MTRAFLYPTRLSMAAWSKSGLFKLGVATPWWVAKWFNGGREILNFRFLEITMILEEK